MTENELYRYVVDKAATFGMKSKNERDRTSNVTNDRGNAVIRHNTGDNPYFALIGKDEETSGKYNGLSFVIFPNKVDDGVVRHCVMSICIGSATLGNDTAMACNPGFRRSFMKLVNGKDCQFFFAENWGDMESRTPGLKEAVEETNDETLSNTVSSYDDNPAGGREGLMPAACLLTFAEGFDPADGIPVIDAWLAQYAQWRLWDTNRQSRENADAAINNVRVASKSNADLGRIY